ncbi:N-6 DNA methylase, partial [Anaerolineales bacterium HSG25]|nr:N-6 DNA methylase [Anaerolineales bacterium HSG25]
MNVLENTLEKIQLTSENGLLFCNRLNEARHISERYYIQEKSRDEKFKPTAILFRRKHEQNKVINSKPVLYIYEKENSFFNSKAHKELHAKIWSAGEIELYFIVSNTRIDIINARKPAEIQDNKLDVQNLRLVSEAIEQFNDQRFSAIVFGKGTFWEQEDFYHPQKDDNFYNNQLKEENTPFHQLLEYLMIVRKHLHDNQKHFSPETIDKLLIVSILIKFLEEIKDDHGTHTLKEIYKKHLIKDFAMALEAGKCLSILNALGSEFRPDNNGNIFDSFSDEERGKIAGTEFLLVAQFLRATLDLSTGQYFLWGQYSFNYLPVELISAIYERFLSREERGVVYTPPFLVNFLIDEVMPLNKAEIYFPKNKFKVLDPSCGSGVFLVAAYKRMLEWWSINDYYEN